MPQHNKRKAKFEAGQGSGKIHFLGGAAKQTDIERLQIPQEVPILAFAGRSNVGKSSLLNAMTGSKIARVSAEPGKTREMNFYLWREYVLCDLPGYGYAKVSKDLRAEWGAQITKFLKEEESLRIVICLVDGRHGYQTLDEQLVGFLQESGLPYLVAFTKMDKHKSHNVRKKAESMLRDQSEELGVVDYVYCSSEEPGGVTALSEYIRKLVI